MFAPWRSQKSVRKRKDPITGNSFIKRVCIGIFTTALGNKKNTITFLIKRPHFYFHSALLSDRLLLFNLIDS